MSLPKPNFNHMLQLIDEVFATRNDPDQIHVNQDQLKKLQAIHPATLSELSDENGPLVWVLMIPTTSAIMTDFLSGNISEKQVLDRTIPGQAYDCLYLCSATTLPEARGKGLTKKVCLEAIAKISEQHNIRTLFVWPFSAEGSALAGSLAKQLHLNLFIKEGH